MIIHIWKLFGRRITRRRYIFFTIFGLVVFLYFEINVNIQGSYFWRQRGRCRNSPGDDQSLRYLITNSHEILNKLNLHHFLIYGSLWGALRYNDPLPWDYDYDFGILYEDIMKTDITRLQNEFEKKGIAMYYQYYAGNYKVRSGNMTGDLMIFRDYYNDSIMRRTGIESWLLFIHYRYYHQFPKELIAKPLSTMTFAGAKFFVPRGGIEIQKYFYPRNWWIQVIPPGCSLNKTPHTR